MSYLFGLARLVIALRAISTSVLHKLGIQAIEVGSTVHRVKQVHGDWPEKMESYISLRTNKKIILLTSLSPKGQ